LILTFGLSIMLCLALIPAARAVALCIGLVDRPDGRRKIHGRLVPVAGGLAVFITVWLVIAAATFLPHPLQQALAPHAHTLVGLFLAGVIVVAAGVADDLGWLRGRHKLVGQIAAIVVLIRFGVYVERIELFGATIELGFLGGLFTGIFLLGAINSLNLIDGMDGLLGCIGWWLSLTLACMAAVGDQWWAVMVALALAGALFAFLRYNLPPASVFMGDAGSMFVGLVLGTLAISCSTRAPASSVMLLPIGLLLVPFLDTTAAIVRRKLTGRSIYTTDRGHLHHCLLRRGLSVRLVLVVVSVCCVITGSGVLAGQAFDSDLIVLLTMGAVAGTLVWTRLFGHAEAILIKERMLSLLQPASPARQIEVRLQGSSDWRPLWKVLTDTADRLQLQEMLLDVNAPALHEGYHARWDRAAHNDEVPTLWRLSIPLTAGGQAIGRLEIAAHPDHDPIWVKIAEMTHVIEMHTQEPALPAAAAVPTVSTAEV
jgi:UDP-GlcNAc:undecaprenyl-phosphate/decaprenyl-phosphate GlcNAc-1-phosphate transferase